MVLLFLFLHVDLAIKVTIQVRNRSADDRLIVLFVSLLVSLAEERDFFFFHFYYIILFSKLLLFVVRYVV